jgi:hypothetical protein
VASPGIQEPRLVLGDPCGHLSVGDAGSAWSPPVLREAASLKSSASAAPRMRVVACLVSALVLAGCCTPPVHPSEVPLEAPSEGGVGDRVVTVRVTDPGAPVQGVPVLLFWVSPENPQSNGRTNLVALGLRTAADGTVVGRVPGNATIHVTAGGYDPRDPFNEAAGWTAEWVLDAAAADGKPVDLALPVYPRAYNFTVNGTWSTVSATTYHDVGLGYIPWNPVDVLPGGTPEARQGFADRLWKVNMSLEWNNEGTTLADFALAAYHANVDGAYCVLADEDQTAAFGPQREVLQTRDTAQDLACGWTMPVPTNGTGLLAGPASGRLALAPFGAKFNLAGTLYFGYPSSFEELCGRLAGEYQTQGAKPREGEAERSSSKDYSVQFQDPDSGELSQPENRTASSVRTSSAAGVATLVVFVLALAVRRRS